MPHNDPLRVFVGFDSREPTMFRVCCESMRARSTAPVCITPLTVTTLEHAGLYRRRWHIVDGQFYDDIDGKPFSTEFSFSRFLVPALSLWRGWALFCDEDLLWRDDIAKLFAQADPAFALQVVKHDFTPKDETKMRGQKQTRYYRKLWSSVVLWNCEHPANRMLTPERVNERSGQWLHAFSWLEAGLIGELADSWNWIPRHSDGDDPAVVHYTHGTPDMPGRHDEPFADEWWDYARAV